MQAEDDPHGFDFGFKQKGRSGITSPEDISDDQPVDSASDSQILMHSAMDDVEIEDASSGIEFEQN